MMLRRIDEGFFRSRRTPPEDEYYTYSFLRKGTDSRISEIFPSFSLVRGWLSLSHCQYGIEEEHSLLCPVSEISVCSFENEV